MVHACGGRPVPERQPVDEEVERAVVAFLLQFYPGSSDEGAKVCQVEHSWTGHALVAVASAQEVGAGRAAGQRGLEQPAQRADVLLDDVQRTGRGILAPHQVDQLVGADRVTFPGEQQREQICLLPRPGTQFDGVTPYSKGSENLQSNRRPPAWPGLGRGFPEDTWRTRVHWLPVANRAVVNRTELVEVRDWNLTTIQRV